MSRFLSIKASAKINLSLNVLPEIGEKGFFQVRFMNVQASLTDLIELREVQGGAITLIAKENPAEENLALKAARLIHDSFGLGSGLELTLVKRIPTRAGLGGGSADAAAVINGMNELFGLSLSSEKRAELAKTLGMDVCYCVIGGLCSVGGIGDVIQPFPCRLPSLQLLISDPPVKKPSTAWAYSLLDRNAMGKNLRKYDELAEGILKQDFGRIAISMHNDFENPVREHFAVVGEMKRCMVENGALGAMLAGSGLSVFGIFEKPSNLAMALKLLEEKGMRCFQAQTL